MVKFLKIVILSLMFFSSSVLAQNLVVLNENDIIEAVQKEFVEQGVDDKIELEIFGGQSSFTIEDAQNVRVMITKLEYDAGQNKFSAQAEIFADGESYAKTKLSGRYFVMEEVLVPAQNIEKGKILTAEMLKPLQMRKNRLKAGHLTTSNQLVGFETKKSLREGKLVTDRDVGAVILIKKGKMVTSVYKSKGLQITARAEAQEDGAMGQRIELVNSKSGKKFIAKVVDADTVEIDGQ